MVTKVVMTKQSAPPSSRPHVSMFSIGWAPTREGVVVTKRGKPVARVVPMVNRPDRIVGALKGDIEVIGDVVSPVGVTWKATKR
jgi:hypothetical protein